MSGDLGLPRCHLLRDTNPRRCDQRLERHGHPPIKAVNPNALFGSRALAMTHVAQFDAVNAVARCYQPYAADLSAPGASAEAAAAQAAYYVLTNLYPTQGPLLDAALSVSLAAVPGGQSKLDGIAL